MTIALNHLLGQSYLNNLPTLPKIYILGIVEELEKNPSPSNDTQVLQLRQLLQQKTEFFCKQYSSFLAFLRNVDYELYLQIFEQGNQKLQDSLSSNTYSKLYRKFSSCQLDNTSLVSNF